MPTHFLAKPTRWAGRPPVRIGSHEAANRDGEVSLARTSDLAGSTNVVQGTMSTSFGARSLMSGSRTILIADDDSNDVFLLTSAFQKAGVDVRINSVSDGDEVIRYLKDKGDRPGREDRTLPRLLVLD